MNFDDLNKIAGAVIGALLVFLLLGFFGGQIFGTRGHHGDHEPLAFALETGGDDGGQEESAIDYAALLALGLPVIDTRNAIATRELPMDHVTKA